MLSLCVIMHRYNYWGTDNAQELAQGLREALNQTGKMERHEEEEMEE